MPTSLATDAVAAVRTALGLAALPTGDTPASPSREVATWEDDRVLAALISLEALARQVEAWRTALATQVDERSTRSAGTAGLAARLGCRNARELLRRVTGCAGSTVSAWLRLGRATQESVGLTGQPLPATFPHVATALAEGRLGFEAAVRIIDALDPVRPVAGDAAVRVAEEELVNATASGDPGGVCAADADSVRVQAKTWASFLDQDGSAPPEADVARRTLRLGGMYRGLVRVSGLLLPEVAAALRAFADSCTNPRTPEVDAPDAPAGESATAAMSRAAGTGDSDSQPTNGGTARPAAGVGSQPSDGAGSQPSDGMGSQPADGMDAHPHDVRDQRTGPQLMHDILASALGAAARVADQSSLAGNSPTVLVAVRASDLEEGRGAAVAFTGDAFGVPAPISIAAARQVACAGAVQRVTLDAAGAVVGLGSAERCFTGQQRRAIALRDGGCVIPGCHVPASWCEVHHVTPYAEDPGGTHVENGCLLCWFHHRTIETSGWEIRMRNGVPEVRPPAWLRGLTHVGSAGHRDDGWRRATGSPTRFLDALRASHHARAG